MRRLPPVTPVTGGSPHARVYSVDQYEASVTLPFPDLERATAALRGALRLRAAYAKDGPQVPDWTTLIVTALDPGTDDHGRTWWRWSGSVTRHL